MVSGIYRIRHVGSGKVYIGSSANIKKRFSQHRTRLKRGNHHSPLLQRAWNKYGAESFVFEVLELVDVADLIASENTHIRAASMVYNFAPAAGTTLGIKLGVLSPEHRAKIAAAHKGKTASDEARATMRRGNKLRPPPSETARANMAKAQTGRKMAPLTPEHRATVSAAHKGKTISEAHKQRLSDVHTGRPQSAETRAKRSVAITAWWASRNLSNVATMPLDLTKLPVVND